MEKNLTMKDAIESMKIPDSDAVRDEVTLSGLVPSSIIQSDIKKDIIVLGITPEAFIKEYAAVEFNFDELCMKFAKHCKDFNDELSMTVRSKALEFSARVLFEIGPYIRNEKKSKGDKAVRFRFPYVKDNEGLSCHTVIVSTFRDNVYNSKDDNDKMMVLTFKQAGMLAMHIFNKVIALAYNAESSVLMTPLCGAVYSRESVPQMAAELGLSEVNIIQMINSSTATGGQHLAHSDMACAIVSMIATTRRVTNKDVRNMMITKVIKQYSARHKEYKPSVFAIVSKYALGGVPPGMDADTLIENFSNIQVSEVNLRARALAMKQTETQVSVPMSTAERTGALPKSSRRSPRVEGGTNTATYTDIGLDITPHLK